MNMRFKTIKSRTNEFEDSSVNDHVFPVFTTDASLHAEKVIIMQQSKIIQNIRLRSEYSSRTVNYFRKRLHFRCFTGF